METSKRQPNTWVQAVKLFNQQKGEGHRWTIPRKPKDGESPSADYLAVRTLMKQFTRPAHEEAKEPKEVREAPKPAKAPRKALAAAAAPVEEEVAVSAGPARKVRKSKSVKDVAPEAKPVIDVAAANGETHKRGRGRPRKSHGVVGSPHELSEGTDYVV